MYNLQKSAAQVAKDLHLETLTSEEELVLPPNLSKLEKSRYLKARNAILHSWRKDITQYLDLDSVLSSGAIPSNDKLFAKVAWDFVNSRGYINFGVSEAILKETCKVQKGEGKSQGSIVVVGAGLAGLAAAHQLMKFGYTVVIVEAKDHPGGRVQTVRMEADGHEAVADLGGAVITGVDGNPLAALARQLNIPMYKIDAEPKDCPLYQSSGKAVPRSLDKQASELFMEAEEEAMEIPDRYTAAAADSISYGTFMKLRMQEDAEGDTVLHNMLRWLYANAEFSAAAVATELSVTRWADDDQFGFTGDHVWLPGGNVRLVQALAEHVPVLYSTPAVSVQYGSDGVCVATADGRALAADAAVVTVPLGVLKNGGLEFCPPLPLSKARAIKRLGFGVLNKVALLFPHQWWGPQDTFGHVAEADEEPGWFYLWYCFPGISGGHMISALVAGQAAIDLEAMSDAQVLQRVMRRLRQYHPTCNVPDPVSSIVTRWGQDPWTLGSYSSVPPGSAGATDYHEVAANVDGRIFFAGEATSAHYPAQMHGAYDSGLREAGKVHAAMRQRAAGTTLQGARMDGLERASMLALLRRAVHVAAAAHVAFRNGPDVQFNGWGAMVAPHAPPDVRRWALLRVDISGVKRMRSHVTPSFHVVPLQVVLDLAEMGHNTEACMHHLLTCATPLKLHNRPLPTAEELDLMEAILGPRAQLPQPFKRIKLADALKKRTAVLMDQEKSKGAPV